MRIALHPEARAEFRVATLWYEEHRSELGEQFVTRVSAALARIADYPMAHPTWPGTTSTRIPIRKARVEQFPYLIAFEVHAEHVLILAIAHAKRRPLYWLARATREPG